MLPAAFISESQPLPAPVPSPQQLSFWLLQICLAWQEIPEHEESVELCRDLGAGLSQAVIALENFARAQRLFNPSLPRARRRSGASRDRSRSRSRSPHPARRGDPEVWGNPRLVEEGVVATLRELHRPTPAPLDLD